MPVVSGKHYAYTKAGKAAAKKARGKKKKKAKGKKRNNESISLKVANKLKEQGGSPSVMAMGPSGRSVRVGRKAGDRAARIARKNLSPAKEGDLVRSQLLNTPV